MSFNGPSSEALPESFQSLLKANRILASTLDIDKLLKIVLELASEVVGAETASLLLVDQRTGELVFNIALGQAEERLKEIHLKMGEGIAGWVAQENKSLIVNDPENDPRWTRKADDKTNFVTRSILCVPMVHQGNILGVVQTINKQNRNGFSEFDRIILEAFASQTAVAIQNAKHFSSLAAEKEKVDTIFSQMTEGAVYCNSSHRAAFANSSAYRLLGVKGDQILRKNIAEIFEGYVLRPSLNILQQSMVPVLDFEAEQGGQSAVILNGIIKKIYSDKKDLIGTLLVFRDVTQLKKEENLKRSFLSLISHKLRTPLVTITGYVPLLLEDPQLQKLDPFVLKAIESVGQQGQILKQLVEKLISFSSVEANAVALTKKAGNALELMRSAVASMQTYLENRQARVVWDSSIESLPDLWVDPSLFCEIVKSLIENAAKFNVKSEKQIVCSGKADETQVYISIADDGRGIPETEQENIFKNFYQIEEFFTGQVEGAGLGLALVKRLVEMHGGTIQVQSKVGQGSTFTISFPLKG